MNIICQCSMVDLDEAIEYMMDNPESSKEQVKKALCIDQICGLCVFDLENYYEIAKNLTSE